MRMKKLCSPACWRAATLGESAPEFRRMGDAALLPYLENSLYEQLVSDLDSSDYFVENVQAVYISQEYLDELAFNSQENVYFGYTLSELNAQFQGEKYIFTLGENDETVAVPWTDYDDGRPRDSQRGNRHGRDFGVRDGFRCVGRRGRAGGQHDFRDGCQRQRCPRSA